MIEGQQQTNAMANLNAATFRFYPGLGTSGKYSIALVYGVLVGTLLSSLLCVG